MTSNFFKKTSGYWFFLYLLLCSLLSMILIIFVQFRSYWGDINLYVSHYLNYNINLVLFFFIILIIPLLYSVYLIFWFIFSTVKKQEITISRVNKIVPIFLFVIFAILGALLLFILDSYTAHL
ncbi:MAG: hypothetical protein ACOC4M_04785, partial [Promethearchaeia archaeon]